jgi:hypothetical protein
MEKSPIVIEFGEAQIRYGFAQDGRFVGTRDTPVSTRKRMFISDCSNLAFLQDAIRTCMYGLLESASAANDHVIVLLNNLLIRLLMVKPPDHDVVVVEGIFMPELLRNSLRTALLETFGVASVLFVSSPLMAALGSGRWSGLIVDTGYRETRVVPVLEGSVAIASMQGAATGLLLLAVMLNFHSSCCSPSTRMARSSEPPLCLFMQDFARRSRTTRTSCSADSSASPCGLQRFSILYCRRRNCPRSCSWFRLWHYTRQHFRLRQPSSAIRYRSRHI